MEEEAAEVGPSRASGSPQAREEEGLRQGDAGREARGRPVGLRGILTMTAHWEEGRRKTRGDAVP